MYSRKRISQNSFPNFIPIIPKSFMVFCQELHNPKRNYENRFKPRLRGCHNEKVVNITIWIWTQAPCITCKYFATGPSEWCRKFPQSCSCQDLSWEYTCAKPGKVTGKNDSPW
jgi:hypothetical protein